MLCILININKKNIYIIYICSSRHAGRRNLVCLFTVSHVPTEFQVECNNFAVRGSVRAASLLRSTCWEPAETRACFFPVFLAGVRLKLSELARIKIVLHVPFETRDTYMIYTHILCHIHSPPVVTDFTQITNYCFIHNGPRRDANTGGKTCWQECNCNRPAFQMIWRSIDMAPNTACRTTSLFHCSMFQALEQLRAVRNSLKCGVFYT